MIKIYLFSHPKYNIPQSTSKRRRVYKLCYDDLPCLFRKMKMGIKLKKTCHVTIGLTHITHCVNKFWLYRPIPNFEAGPTLIDFVFFRPDQLSNGST